MSDFIAVFIEHLTQIWRPSYLPVIVTAVFIGFALRRVARRMPMFMLQVLVLFLLLLVASAGASAMGSKPVAHTLQEIAVIVLGMLLIRQVGLALFRLIIPRLGMRPPRILEELLILLVYVGWFLLRLSYAGLDLSSLLASTAVITAVIAFAMQDTLGNILSGLALQLDHSIHIGDWIHVDQVNGRVVQVQWRHTAVRTLPGELILIPNSQLMKSQVMITGGSFAPKRMRTVQFYCGFEIAPHVLIRVMERELANADLIDISRDSDPVCAVLDFADGMICYGIRYWLTNPETPGGTDSMIRRHIYAIFKREGWNMAAPLRNIHMSDPHSDRTQAVASRQQAYRMEILRGLSLFSVLTSQELTQLGESLSFLPYLEGSIIARQDEVGDCLFIVINGEVDVLLEANGQQRSLAVLKSGQVMGEMSLMTGEPRRATLKARTDVECYALSKRGFEAILRQRPELADSFAQLLAERNQGLTDFKNRMPAAPAGAQKAAILGRIRNIFGLSDAS